MTKLRYLNLSINCNGHGNVSYYSSTVNDISVTIILEKHQGTCLTKCLNKIHITKEVVKTNKLAEEMQLQHDPPINPFQYQ